MGFFDSFTKRVLEAAKSGKLGKEDVGKLQRLFEGMKKRNTILARGILSALKAGKANEKDILKLSKLLKNANEKIATGKEPFSASEKKEIKDIFQSAGVSEKAARWFSLQMDEFLSSELEESVVEKKIIDYPQDKKTVKVEFSQKKQKVGG